MLHMMRRHDGLCDFCWEVEAVEHVILECRKHSRKRVTMLRDMTQVSGLKDINLKSDLVIGGAGRGLLSRSHWAIWR